ncbi:hypothetical protein [[Limnothrix rosea] IAM M-220]|uniref:hypothetical protein n=1 Tax=[Limnothrix rosea] IAM M-220 TaxID=454133 RepID=UPI00095D9DF7|nr:hypothetical protein [[Limnothrix rosea] IAM M-220]OKH19227.1 hypothetical protein NIES208_02960 [[Limnothrix rosea] IAM M-220]
MSLNSALAAIYAEKIVTPQMEKFLTKTVKTRNLTSQEKRSLRELVRKIEAGEILLLSAQ